MIHIVFCDGKLALYQIVKLELVLNRAGGAETKHPGGAFLQLLLNFLQGAVTPHGVLAVVACGLLVGLLFFPHGSQFLFRAEAGIGLSLGHQLFGVDMVNSGPLTLAVGAVNAVVTIHCGAFVKMNTIMLQGVDQNLHSSGNLPLSIGILHPQKQNAAALMRHALGGQALNQVAQVDKSGGRGGHTGDNRAFRYIPQGKSGLQIFRSIRYIREKQLSKCLIIHKAIPHYIFFVIHNITFALTVVNFNIAFSILL